MLTHVSARKSTFLALPRLRSTAYRLGPSTTHKGSTQELRQGSMKVPGMRVARRARVLGVSRLHGLIVPLCWLVRNGWPKSVPSVARLLLLHAMYALVFTAFVALEFL